MYLSFLKSFEDYSLSESFLFIICVVACAYLFYRIFKGGF